MKCDLCGNEVNIAEVVAYEAVEGSRLCSSCYKMVADIETPSSERSEKERNEKQVDDEFEHNKNVLDAVTVHPDFVRTGDEVETELGKSNKSQLKTSVKNRTRLALITVSVTAISIYAFAIIVQGRLDSREVAKANWAYDMTIKVQNILTSFGTVLVWSELLSPIFLIVTVASSRLSLKRTGQKDKNFTDTLVFSLIIGVIFIPLNSYTGFLNIYTILIFTPFVFTFGTYLAFSTIWPIRALQTYKKELTITVTASRILKFVSLQYLLIACFILTLVVKKYLSYGKWFFHLW